MEVSLNKLWETDSEGQRTLVCCSPWGCKELKQLTTEEQQYFYHTTFSVKHNFLIFFLFWYRSYFSSRKIINKLVDIKPNLNLETVCNILMGFPGVSDGEESACSSGDLGLIPALGRSPGEGNDKPFQYSCLENPVDRGGWQATTHWVAKSQTWLSYFTFFLLTFW